MITYLLYILSYGILARPLAYLCDISPTKALCIPGQCSQIYVFRDRWFSQAGFKDTKTWLFIWKRNINQLVKTARSQKCWANDVRPVCGPNNENSLLAVMPSISVRSWLRTRSAAPPASPVLLPLWKNHWKVQWIKPANQREERQISTPNR